MSNDQAYKIENFPGKLFHVVAYDELDDCKVLEHWLLTNGYDGYTYMLQNINDSEELVPCIKKVNGDFVQMQ